jgi:hypothetical protein
MEKKKEKRNHHPLSTMYLGREQSISGSDPRRRLLAHRSRSCPSTSSTRTRPAPPMTSSSLCCAAVRVAISPADAFSLWTLHGGCGAATASTAASAQPSLHHPAKNAYQLAGINKALIVHAFLGFIDRPDCELGLSPTGFGFVQAVVHVRHILNLDTESDGVRPRQ